MPCGWHEAEPMARAWVRSSAWPFIMPFQKDQEHNSRCGYLRGRSVIWGVQGSGGRAEELLPLCRQGICIVTGAPGV